MPRKRKVWIDEDGDGVADAHGEVVVPEVDEVVEDVVEEPVVKKAVAKKAVVKKVKKNKDADAERRRRRLMGF